MSIRLFDHFASLEDPRVDRTKLHALMDIVALTICGVVCGADGWDDIHFYACSLESWYRTFLPLKHGIPSSDTIVVLFPRFILISFMRVFSHGYSLSPIIFLKVLLRLMGRRSVAHMGRMTRKH